MAGWWKLKWYDMIDRVSENSNDTMKCWTGNNIGSEGGRKLSEALKCNNKLDTLDLGGDENWKKRNDCMTWYCR